jgi:hypothetical protein
MNPKLMVLLLLISIPTAVFCLDFTVDYVYGIVEVQTDSRWQPVEIGTTVSGDSSLRVGHGAVAELSSGSIRITIGEQLPPGFFLGHSANGSKQNPQPLPGPSAK